MKKLSANLLIFFTTLAFALLLAEIAARYFLDPPQVVKITSSQTPFPTTSTGEKRTLTLAEHPDEGGVYIGSPTGKRLRPHRRITIENHRLSHEKVLIETNSLGYRNREIAQKQGVRILFLGDSVTFQDFLNEQDTFVRQVEQRAQAAGKNWETINAGVGAISLKTELAILQETGLALKPDVVVLGFYLNDFQESKGVQVIHLPLLLQKSWFAYHLTEWVNQQRGKHLANTELDLEDWKMAFKQQHNFANGHFNQSPEAFNQMLLDNFTDYGAAWSDQTWKYMKPLFVELKHLSEQHSFKLIIVGFPVYQQVYTEFIDDRPQQQLKKIGEELGVPVLDLLTALRTEALRLRQPSMYHTETFYADLFYDQCHHTAQGSKRIAGEIYSFLQTQLTH